jgi:hypothetical protein
LLEFFAFVAHGSPRCIGRERVTLSVIDGYRNRAMITLTIHCLSGSRDYYFEFRIPQSRKDQAYLRVGFSLDNQGRRRFF